MATDDAVSAGRAALTAGRWKDARAAFESALAERETAEALDGLAHALAGLGEYAAAIKLRERAFAAFRARGEIRYPAVLAAYWLAFEYLALYGNAAAASGWLERGKRLADAAGDGPERGWVALGCALAAEDFDEKQRHIDVATQAGIRFADADLEFDARAHAGVCLVERGDVGAGLRRLDEAVAAATSGEVRSIAVAGEIYCKMLLACEMAFDVRRAEQWTSVVESFAADTNALWALAICRMHYGGILIAAGRWPEADTELCTSLRLYDASYRALRSGSVARLADLRVRQGRLEEAERLLAGYEHDGYAVRPLARLHLARGSAELAVSELRRRLAQCGSGLDQAPILILLAEATAATGHAAGTRAAAERLAEIADRSGARPLQAYASLVSGLAAGVEAATAARADTGADAGDGAGHAVADERVIGHFEAALLGFGRSGLALEEARTRLHLARALSSTQRVVAIAEAQRGLSVLESVGAAADADMAAALLRSLGGRSRTGPKQVGVLSQREQEVLRLVGLGLSNPEIAARLYISRKTAAHHVSSVLAKLGLRNRAEAAAHASALDVMGDS